MYKRLTAGMLALLFFSCVYQLQQVEPLTYQIEKIRTASGYSLRLRLHEDGRPGVAEYRVWLCEGTHRTLLGTVKEGGTCRLPYPFPDGAEIKLERITKNPKKYLPRESETDQIRT